MSQNQPSITEEDIVNRFNDTAYGYLTILKTIYQNLPAVTAFIDKEIADLLAAMDSIVPGVNLIPIKRFLQLINQVWAIPVGSSHDIHLLGEGDQKDDDIRKDYERFEGAMQKIAEETGHAHTLYKISRESVALVVDEDQLNDMDLLDPVDRNLAMTRVFVEAAKKPPKTDYDYVRPILLIITTHFRKECRKLNLIRNYPMWTEKNKVVVVQSFTVLISLAKCWEAVGGDETNMSHFADIVDTVAGIFKTNLPDDPFFQQDHAAISASQREQREERTRRQAPSGSSIPSLGRGKSRVKK